MKTKLTVRLIPALLILITAVLFCTACAVQSADTSGAALGANLAVVANPTSSYVSGDTTLAALNDGFDPKDSQDDSHRSYGNWNRTGKQWVQYEWSQPISTSKIDVYWWADGQGVHAPKASRLFYWDDGEFVPVKNATGLGVAEDKYNTTTFDEITTKKNQARNGCRWHVLYGHSRMEGL